VDDWDPEITVVSTEIGNSCCRCPTGMETDVVGLQLGFKRNVEMRMKDCNAAVAGRLKLAQR